jgi:hypothetical protein
MNLLIVRWAFVTDCRMQSARVIKTFNVFKDISSSFIMGFVSGGHIQFGLQRPEDAFYNGVVPAVSSSAYAAH